MRRLVCGFLLIGWAIGAWFIPTLVARDLAGPMLLFDAQALAWSLPILWAGIWSIYADVDPWLWLASGLALLTSFATDLRLLALLMVMLALLPRWSWRERTGLGLSALTLLAWGWLAQGWIWSSQRLGAFAGPEIVTALVLSMVCVLGLLPFNPRQPRAPHSLVVLVVLVPLWRLYQTGPVATAWALVGLGIGSGAALWLVLQAFGRSAEYIRLALTQAWWALAFAPILLATETGLAATWVLCLAASLMSTAERLKLAGWPLWVIGGAFLPCTGFVSLWLLGGAVLAGGMPLFLGLIWLLAFLMTLLCILVRAEVQRWYLLPGAALLLGLALPTLLYRVVEPMLQALGAGLTLYGRTAALPWVGLAVRDSGARTGVTLPLVVLAGVLVILGAAAWLLVRVVPLSTPSESVGTLHDQTLWRLIQRRLPWNRTALVRSEEHDDV